MTFSWVQAIQAGAWVPAPGCDVARLRFEIVNDPAAYYVSFGEVVRPCWRHFYLYGTATTLALAVALASMLYLTSRLTAARESGELLRVRSSPMSLWVYLAGHLAGAAFALLFMAVFLIAVAQGMFHIPLDMERVIFATPILALGLLAFASIGLLIAAVSRTPTFALGLSFTLVFAMVAASSVFHSPVFMPNQLYEMAGWFPLQALSLALYTVIEPDIQGSRIAWEPITKLAGWAVAGLPWVFWFPTMRGDR